MPMQHPSARMGANQLDEPGIGEIRVRRRTTASLEDVGDAQARPRVICAQNLHKGGSRRLRDVNEDRQLALIRLAPAARRFGAALAVFHLPPGGLLEASIAPTLWRPSASRL